MAMRCEPPSATGQPTAWAGGHEHEAERRRQEVVERKEGVGGAAGEERRASSVANQRRARRSSPAPGREGRSGRARAGGGAGAGASRSPSAPARPTARPRPPTQRRYAAASSPEAARRLVDRPLQQHGAAAVQRVGQRTFGLQPAQSVALERQLRQVGRAGAEGWMAEQTSWTKPGSVSSALRVPPPTVSDASTTSTDRPACGERDGRRQPVRPRSHDDGVVRGAAHELSVRGGRLRHGAESGDMRHLVRHERLDVTAAVLGARRPPGPGGRAPWPGARGTRRWR